MQNGRYDNTNNRIAFYAGRYGADKYDEDNIVLYNVLANNCVQSCIDALMLGHFYLFDTYYKRILYSYRKLMVPNLIYTKLCMEIPTSMIIFDDWYL